MKKSIIAALLAIATGSSFAAVGDPFSADYKFQSTKTRAEVQAEVVAAYHEGTLGTQAPEFVDSSTIAVSSSPVPPVAVQPTPTLALNLYKVNDPYSAAHGFVSTKTRAQVIAEMKAVQ